MTSLADSLRLALTTLTVLPLRGPRDLQRARAAMAFAPLVGALLGLAVWAAAWPLHGPVKGAVMAGLIALLTRGMHLDGLADTVDALGSYRGRERALEIMRSPEVGPFGVASIVVVLLIQALTLGGLDLIALVLALAVGRLAATIGCQRGVPAARADGLGAFVSGTTTLPLISAYFVVLGVVAGLTVHPWKGPATVVAAIGVTYLLRRHATRRLGGITGDVLGFMIEAATLTMLIGLSQIP